MKTNELTVDYDKFDVKLLEEPYLNEKIREALIRVAEMVYNKEPGPFKSGLCWATIYIGYPDTRQLDIYRVIDQYMKPKQTWVCKPGTKWEQRAMFALLIAEDLKNENQ